MIAGNGVAVTAMVSVVCVSCGMEFHVPKRWDDAKRESHKGFYCPAGHSLQYNGESPKEKALRIAQSEAKRERENAQWYQARLESEQRSRVSAEHRLRAAKGQQTKLKKRIAAGVCPCCHRTFTNLARHMASQHADYTEAVLDA